uniref:myopalladin isoform X2 n=1 Tax=Myxine glutinosa TaxID=7769 RepID=UPI00358F321D
MQKETSESGVSLHGSGFSREMSDPGLIPELSAFLSQEELNKSVHLAREAINDDIPAYVPPAPQLLSGLDTQLNAPLFRPSSENRSLGQDNISMTTENNSDRQTTQNGSCVLPKQGPGCSNRADPAPGKHNPYLSETDNKKEFANKAAALIEELSTLFKAGPRKAGLLRVRREAPLPFTSPVSSDSGYQSPNGNTVRHAANTNTRTREIQPLQQQKQQQRTRTDASQVVQCVDKTAEKDHGLLQERPAAESGDVCTQAAGVVEGDEELQPPHFTHRLKSREVPEGSRVQLDCRLSGNPTPVIRWFCEGKRVEDSPDMQILVQGDLHCLIIAEAFQEDTGRYTCIASNAVGSDSTSAEVYIEGTTSSDSDTESPSQDDETQTTKKISMSMNVTPQVQSTALEEVPQISSPDCGHVALDEQATGSALIFTKPLQDVAAATGQLVVMECRIKGLPSPVVTWFRDRTEIEDSPDFRILQKKPRSAAEAEEICTLVISEALPEDSGTFICTAENKHGSVSCSARLFVHDIKHGIQTAAPASSSMIVESSSYYPTSEPSFLEGLEALLPTVIPKSIEPCETESPMTNVREVASIPCISTAQSSLTSGIFGEGPHSEKETITQLPVTIPVIHSETGDIGVMFGEAAASGETKASGKIGLHVHFKLPGEDKTSAGSSPGSPGQGVSSPGKEPPPLPVKPKLDPLRLQQLHNQVLLEQQEANILQLQSQQPWVTSPPPIPIRQTAASNTCAPPAFTVTQTSNNMSQSFSYTRPKQFIVSQSLSTTSASLNNSPVLSGQVSPPYQTKAASQASAANSCLVPTQPSTVSHQGSTPSSSLWLNTNIVASTASSVYAAAGQPLTSFSQSGTSSPSQHPGRSLTQSNSPPPFVQSPAAFLSSVLPSLPSLPPTNAMGLPKYAPATGDCSTSTTSTLPQWTGPAQDEQHAPRNQNFYHASPAQNYMKKQAKATTKICSDDEIRDSKDALMQDLEKKLRLKDEILHNGQSRLTYEEKMARRLLGPLSAASVFQHDEVGETETEAQEYKVSSFEQRLMNEIEFRLERSPVDESDDDVQHDDIPTGRSIAPYLDRKLKHYKVFEGSPVTFSCRLSGTPLPKIYWFKDGIQLSKKLEHYVIQREADGACSLHISDTTVDDDGNYTIMAANPQGRISCTGRLMVQTVTGRCRSSQGLTNQSSARRPRSRSREAGEEGEAVQQKTFRPHFLQAPGDTVAHEGKLCRLDCKVSGLPTPDLSWQLNGRPLHPDPTHKMLVRENGVHSLIIESLAVSDSGTYTCMASNQAGQTSFSLQLNVVAKQLTRAPVFVEKLQNTGVAEGYPVRLECRILAVPAPSIFWKKENEMLQLPRERFGIHQDGSGYVCLLIQPALKEDGGWYTVSAKNEVGISSCTARLDIYVAQWHHQLPQPRRVRPSSGRYAVLTDQGLDVRSAFMTDHTSQAGLVESDEL